MHRSPGFSGRRRRGDPLSWARRTWPLFALLLLVMFGLWRYAQREAPLPAKEPGTGAPQKFYFYEMLKKVEVPVPEEPTWQAGGMPMLQVGFFEQRRLAEARRTHLASLDMEARVLQHDSGWRVLLGPFSSRRALQKTRERLQLENIEVRRISIPRALLREEMDALQETGEP